MNNYQKVQTYTLAIIYVSLGFCLQQTNKTMTSYQALAIPAAILEMLQWVNTPQNPF